MRKFQFAILTVTFLGCHSPEGTIVSSISILDPHGRSYSARVPFQDYVAEFPGIKIKVGDVEALNFEDTFDPEGLILAVENLILQSISGELDGIITTQEEFQALEDFCYDFATHLDGLEIHTLRNLILSPELASRITESS